MMIYDIEWRDMFLALYDYISPVKWTNLYLPATLCRIRNLFTVWNPILQNQFTYIICSLSNKNVLKCLSTKWDLTVKSGKWVKLTFLELWTQAARFQSVLERGRRSLKVLKQQLPPVNNFKCFPWPLNIIQVLNCWSQQFDNEVNLPRKSYLEKPLPWSVHCEHFCEHLNTLSHRHNTCAHNVGCVRKAIWLHKPR